jgi:hypothetical protein
LIARLAVLTNPRWRAISAAAIAVIGLAAFAWRGPIGIGNGPLSLPSTSGGYGGGGPAREPFVYVLPLFNSSGSTAVIDSVDVVSAAGYPATRVLSIRVGRYAGYNCTDVGPVRSLTGCVQPALAPVTGYAIPAAPLTAAHGPGLVVEMAGPATAQCAVITKIVLHYHVGIRHYAGSYPQGTVSICAPHAHLPPGSLPGSPAG